MVYEFLSIFMYVLPWCLVHALFISTSQVDNVAAESVLEEEAVDEAALEEQDRVALAAEDQNALNARNAVNQASQQQLQAIDQQQAAANQGGFLGWLW